MWPALGPLGLLEGTRAQQGGGPDSLSHPLPPTTTHRRVLPPSGPSQRESQGRRPGRGQCRGERLQVRHPVPQRGSLNTTRCPRSPAAYSPPPALPGTLTRRWQSSQDTARGHPMGTGKAHCRHHFGEGRGRDGLYGAQSDRNQAEPNLHERWSFDGGADARTGVSPPP